LLARGCERLTLVVDLLIRVPHLERAIAVRPIAFAAIEYLVRRAGH
jgi:hypothetical protein